MNVVWTLEAQRDREDIFEFNAASDPLDAVRVDERFSSAAQRLGYQPLKGRAASSPRASTSRTSTTAWSTRPATGRCGSSRWCM